MSVTGAAPFNGASDQGLGVAYISVFLLVFLVISSFQVVLGHYA
jgi:auxin efflux carrier family protein